MKKLKSVEKLRQVVLDYKKSKNLAKPLLIWFNANNHLDDFKKTILSDSSVKSIDNINCDNLINCDTEMIICHRYFKQMDYEALKECSRIVNEKKIPIIYLANIYEFKSRPDFVSELYDEITLDIQNVIILNHMFSGKYLDKNIGHEIINLFRADDNKQYIYLCKDGKFNRTDVCAQYVVQVCRPYQSKGTLKILNVASKLALYNSEDINNPKYGKKSIYEIFSNNIEQQENCITFTADLIGIPQIPLYIWQNEQHNNNSVGVVLSNINTSQHLREYIYEELDENGCTKKDSDYYKLKCLIEGSNTMDYYNQLPCVETDCEINPSMVEIYGIEWRELSYSNALKYFIEKYPSLFKELFNISKEDKIIRVLREYQHIDILIETESRIIVVENKIFSNLNGEDSSQLVDYERKILEKTKDERDVFYLKKPTFYLLLTNHNNIELENNSEWKKIKYGDLYNFLIESDEYKSDNELKEFVKAIELHSENDFNFNVMKKRFVRAILKKITKYK